MAKILTVDLDNGVHMENSYVRVETVLASKTSINYEIRYFKSKEFARIYPDKPFFTENSSCPTDVSDGAPNYHKQAYLHLNSDPKFDSAIDDLDD